jgi:hypothetical protein
MADIVIFIWWWLKVLKTLVLLYAEEGSEMLALYRETVVMIEPGSRSGVSI